MTGPAWAQDIRPATANVLTHIALHELGHAVIREFDLPVLSNEEAMADAFAAHILLTQMPDRAAEILTDQATYRRHRAEVDPGDPGDEHPDPLRRAAMAGCLMMGLRPREHVAMAREIGLSDDQLRACADFGTEVHRSWRRVLAPLRMPEGEVSGEVRVIHGDGPAKVVMEAAGVMETVGDVARGFDFHSGITLHFDQCDGEAGWSRNGRTVLICDAMIAQIDAAFPE